MKKAFVVEAEIKKVPDIDGAHVEMPFNTRGILKGQSKSACDI